MPAVWLAFAKNLDVIIDLKMVTRLSGEKVCSLKKKTKTEA